MSRARGSIRRMVVLAAMAALATIVMVAGPAGALGDGGVLIEPGAEEVDRSGLASAVQQARGDGVRLSVAVLAADPPGGAEAEADRLVSQVGGAVLVLSPGEVGAVSDAHSNQAVDRAFDAAGDQFGDGGDVVAGVRAFAAELARDSGSSTDSGGGGGLGAFVPILVIGAVILFVVRMLGRRRRGRGVGGPGGFGQGGFGNTGRRRRGGFGRSLVGGAIGGAVGSSMGNRNRSARGSTTRASSSNRSRGSSSRSRGSSSRPRGGGSRGGGSRRR